MEFAYPTVVYKTRGDLRRAFCDWQVYKHSDIKCFILNKDKKLIFNYTNDVTILGPNCPTKPAKWTQKGRIENGIVVKLY